VKDEGSASQAIEGVVRIILQYCIQEESELLLEINLQTTIMVHRSMVSYSNGRI
jgi:hypothetical protein